MVKQGTDVSRWQDNPSTPQRIDFVKMQANGVEFVIMKASQALWTDRDFVYNWQAAKQTSLLRGAYHFLDWSADPLKQAEYFWSLLKDDPGELAPTCDFEWNPGADTPPDAISRLERFLERLEQLSGRIPMIYTSAGFWKPLGRYDVINGVSVGRAAFDPRWIRYPLWVAHYTTGDPIIPTPWTTYAIHQYSSTGDGAAYGVESKGIDLDRSGIDFYKIVYTSSNNGGTMFENSQFMVMLYDPDPAKATPTADFAALAAQGVEVFAVRMMFSKDGAKTTEDPAYKAAYPKVKATKRLLGGIIKLNANLDQYDYDSAQYQLQGVREIVGSTYIPDLFIVSVEDPKMADGDICTAPNLMDCIKGFVEALWTKYRKPVLVYTGSWFIKSYLNLPDQGVNGFEVWAGNNCVETNERFPLILVHWITGSQPITNLKETVKALPAISSEVETTKLSAGNARWRGWDAGQFTHTAIGTGKEYARLVIFRDLPGSAGRDFSAKALYEWLLAVYPGSYVPGQEPEPEPEPTDPTVLAVVNRIESALTELRSRFDAHFK